jgi:prepilin peptidase CpaA
MTYPPLVIQVLLLVLAVTACVTDARTRRVPNWLTATGFLLGLGLNYFLFETPGFLMALKGAGIALLIYFPLYLLRGMGAGDVKLMAAAGALVGPTNWLGILLCTSIFGGILAVIAVARRGRAGKTFENIRFILTSLRAKHAPYQLNPELDVRNAKSFGLPHAIPVAFGCIAFLAAAAIWAPR